VTFDGVRAAQPKPCAFMERELAIRFRLADFRGDSGGYFASRAESTRWLHRFARSPRCGFGQIHAHHRRSLSQSVAFENSFPESFFEALGEVEWQFLRAGDDKPQAAELMRFRFTQVTTKKSRRGQQKSQFVLFDQSGVLCHLERIWISDDTDR